MYRPLMQRRSRHSPAVPFPRLGGEAAGDPLDAPVRVAMRFYPESLQPWVTAAAVLDRYLLLHRYAVLPLTEGGVAVGLVTLARVRSVPAAARATTCLRDLAEPLSDVPVVPMDEPLSAVLPRIEASRHRLALVVGHDGALVGVLGAAELERLPRLLARMGHPGAHHPGTPVAA